VGPREFHAEISSTQDRAIELARNGATEGTRVVARRQHAGRGRLDHVWESPSGGLYLSIVLSVPAEHPTLLPLAVGARIAHELGEQYSLPLAVKWPNDVLVLAVGRIPRKVAGVLVDRIDRFPSPPVGIAGIGVNVANPSSTLPGELRAHAVALSELMADPPSLDEVEEVVVHAAVTAAAALREPEGIEATRTLCRRRLFGLGQRAIVDGRPIGTIAGLGDEGELLVDDGPDRVTIRAGDLRVEEAA
jgi:BirA family transcriptional regulator, biotin operon repressor / biotin---[acetyl-CoA-carboxylase] ligase